MFEKEAEERAEKLEKNQTLGVYDNDEDLARDEGYNDGEVAGYENGFIEGAEFGYNKANEWHYVKDGDLPNHENYVLVSNGKDWTKGFYKDKKWSVIHLVGFTKIIMWKEIVLPKESE